MNDGGHEIRYEAPDAIRNALGRLGRVEDVRFSPTNRRMALIAYERSSVVLVSVDIAIGSRGPHVTVSGMVEFASPCLEAPHSVDFLDDETILVANREGAVALLQLLDDDALDGAQLIPIELPPGRAFELINAPSALTVRDHGSGEREVLVCNHSGNTLTTHTLRGAPWTVASNDVLVHQWLDLPDGVAVTADDRWIAISNHDLHVVLVYERKSSLNERANPDAVLRGVRYPHGLCFSADGRHLFVADAGKPYVHVYARDGETWQPVQAPVVSIRVVDDDQFQRAMRINPHNSGPKGIDVEHHSGVLAVTSMFKPLAFFDVSAALQCSAPGHADQVTYALQLEREMQEQERTIEARITQLKASGSFRVTKPLRRLKGAWLKARRRDR